MASTLSEGRSYHTTASAYSLPNDATEHERLDAQSRALTTMMGARPFLTDLQTLARNSFTFKGVDVGCGTGILTTALAREVQRSNSRAKVYGVDISPVPLIHERPDSVEYVQGNFKELPGVDPRFQLDSFDFITHRMLVIGMVDWSGYIRQCFDLLKPGGRIEIQDVVLRYFDIHGIEDLPNPAWLNVFRKATSKIGFDSLAPETLKQLMLDTGFADVEERTFAWPTSDHHWEEHPDSHEIGWYTTHVSYPTFTRALKLMAQKAGLEKDGDLDGLDGVNGVEENFFATMTNREKGNHAKFYVVCGRKPDRKA